MRRHPLKQIESPVEPDASLLERLTEPLLITGSQSSNVDHDIAVGERRFIRGHLAQALEDATKPLPKLNRNPSREASYRYRRCITDQAEALAWLDSDEDDYIGSFLFDCAILNLDPSAVRAAVYAARRQGVYFVRHHENAKLNVKARLV